MPLLKANMIYEDDILTPLDQEEQEEGKTPEEEETEEEEEIE